MSFDSIATLHASAERCAGRVCSRPGENAAAVVRRSGSERALRAMGSNTHPDTYSPACTRVARAWQCARDASAATLGQRSTRENRQRFSCYEKKENARGILRKKRLKNMCTHVISETAAPKSGSRQSFAFVRCTENGKRPEKNSTSRPPPEPFSPPPTSPPARR